MNKLFLAALCTASMTLTSYSYADGTTKAATETSTVNVIKSLEGKTQVLKDGAYVKEDVAKDTEYFVVYYTASW